MLVAMWLGFGIAAALAGPGNFGKNFTVSFEDMDGLFEQQAPRLWVVAPEGAPVEVSLRDDGGQGDAEAGDSVYSGTVGELPDAQVVVYVDGPSGEIWRQDPFFVPADMQYPALRLKLENGVVEGGLKADLSPEEQRVVDREGHPVGNTGEGGLRGALQDSQQRISLLILILLVAAPALMLWRERRARGRMAQERAMLSAADLVLGIDLPHLQAGLQVWTSAESFESLRNRLAVVPDRNCEIFWLSVQPSAEPGFSGLHTWTGPKLELVQALRWRLAVGSTETPPGPLFIEGLEALYLGYGERTSQWIDLQSLAQDCPVVILRRALDSSGGWVAEEPPEEWLQAAGEDQPLA
ncbi:MAG: choice-of-anchor X domain-containing protein [Myxococcota bacterium]|nr:choice-of-anchor X domain-containing protein [Myxococcota bacterium]